MKADLEDKAGGAVGQNRYHVYSLSPSDQAYLQTLLHASGASVDTVDTWLDAMNARNTYAGSLEGADYTAAYRDGLVLPSQETVLRQTLDATGQLLKKRQLRQVYVEANGHCTLTQAEWTVALEAMERRLDTGVWPGNAFFPNNMGGPVVPEYDQRLRFNNAFNPGPFPQPPSP